MDTSLPAKNTITTALPARNEIRQCLTRFLEEGEDESFDWERLTTEEGLPHNWIYDLFRDSRERIWIGTWGGGLVIVDGNRRTCLSANDGLASNSVTAFAEDRDGTVWITTDRGINAFRDGRLSETYLAGRSFLTVLVDHRNRVWAGAWRMSASGGGLHRYDGSGWRSFSTADGMPGQEILKVFEDSRGHIWIGTYEMGKGAGAGCWDGTRWHSYTQTDGLASDCVYSMFEDPEGNTWFGTVGGVSMLSRETGAFTSLTTADGLVDNRVYCMMIDSGKKMWFGTEGGVSRYDGRRWQTFTKYDGLPENLVRTIIEDADNKMWFGTYPYASGRGGIGIGKRKRADRKTLLRRLEKVLPKHRGQGALPGME